MLGNDFYNKSIMNGVTEQEAVDSAKTKRKQEVLATVQEAISQYFLLGAFASFSNNSKIGAPLLNTALGILFHITSRISTGRELTRIKINDSSQPSFLSINKFINSVKENKHAELKKQKLEKDDKNHILSLKNILLATGASIGVGFALKGIKSTKTFNNIKEQITNLDFVKDITKKYRNFTVGEVRVSKDDINNLYNTYAKSGFISVAKTHQPIFDKAFSNPKLVKQFKNPDGTTVKKILLGEYEKMSKIPFTNIQASRKELLHIPLMPFRFVTELFSYPYKAVHKILEGLKIVKKPEKIELKNEYHLLNTYLDFKEQLAKFGGEVNKDFLEFYRKHIEQNRISALNFILTYVSYNYTIR